MNLPGVTVEVTQIAALLKERVCNGAVLHDTRPRHCGSVQLQSCQSQSKNCFYNVHVHPPLSANPRWHPVLVTGVSHQGRDLRAEQN